MTPRLAPDALGIGQLLFELSHFRAEAVDVALRWSEDSYSDSILSFANGVHTPQGHHVELLDSHGFWTFRRPVLGGIKADLCK